MGKSLLQLAVERSGTDWFEAMSPEERSELLYNWSLVGRPEQQAPPRPWRVWLFMAGRGGGKTRSASEWVRYMVEGNHAGQIALVGETAADVRDVMVEQGESSILKTARHDFYPHYEPSKRRLTWPNGAVATTYSGDDPEQLRGPQHDAAWADELGKWKHAAETWSNLMFGLRLNGPDGTEPAVMVTTTPRTIAQLIKLAKGERQLDGTYVRRPDVVVTTCSTYDNAANLAPAFLEEIRREYEGTRLGRQEIDAEILDDVEGALWTMGLIDGTRVTAAPKAMHRINVAVDPTGSETGDECGITAQGVARGDFGSGKVDLHGFLLADKSKRAGAGEWARIAVDLYREVKADRIVAEVNFGGDMVKHTIHSIDHRIPVTVVHASRGKRQRAEPVAMLYEQGRIHHVGAFAQAEDEMTTWVPGDKKSPNRMDALVWGFTDLMVDAHHGDTTVVPGGRIAGIPVRTIGIPVRRR